MSKSKDKYIEAMEARKTQMCKKCGTRVKPDWKKCSVCGTTKK